MREIRIYFKKFSTEEDFNYFSKLTFNEEVMIMNYGRVFTLEESKKFYQGILSVNSKHEVLGYFKVFEKTIDDFIGLAAIYTDDDLAEAEVEYMLLPEYWGKGYGGEIVGELLEVAKTEGINKVTATIDPKNIASRKILTNNGFKSCKTFTINDGSLAETLSKDVLL